MCVCVYIYIYIKHNLWVTEWVTTAVTNLFLLRSRVTSQLPCTYASLINKHSCSNVSFTNISFSLRLIVLQTSDFLCTNTRGLAQSYFPEGPAAVEYCASRKWLYLWSIKHVQKREFIWKSSYNRVESDLLQHDHPTACVIAQQYCAPSSPIHICPPPCLSHCAFIHSQKKFGSHFKNVISVFCFL
jgi:hypothetical protein